MILIFVLLFIVTNVKEALTSTDVSGDLEVHFIDVGQGDSILIKSNEENMLIDGGTRSSKDIVLEYLQKENVESLKYIIGTHPHEDHIGGLAHIIDNIPVEEIIMPNVTTNTKTYENLLNTISKHGLGITKARAGDKYEIGEAEYTLLAPNNDEYSNLNNYSIVAKMVFGKTSFLFTGDAEKISEKEMLQLYKSQLESDVLKLGHHGSNTSTTEDFLQAVDPDHGIISTGKDNRYEHPDKEILNALKKKNVKTYRTDLQGSIVGVSDGDSVKFSNEPENTALEGIYDIVMNGFVNIKGTIMQKYKKTVYKPELI